jgi:signal transduction histidine kinase
LREAKKAAEAANQSKTAFLAMMSHELRTPLNAIIGFSQMMRTETFGPLQGRYAEYAGDIEQSGQHLLAIINDILDIAKAESVGLPLMEENVAIDAIAGAAVQMMKLRAEKAHLALELRIAPDLPALRADARRLKQMLINLLAYAIKFTPPGGTITVTAEFNERRGITIGVSDTGIGIAQEHLASVLEPFYQVDNSLARRHEGTGLGLSIVAAMMARHNGSLRIDSELGKGTVAKLEFPPSLVVSPRDAEKDAQLIKLHGAAF